MRSILVHADGGPAMSTRLQAALEIARASNGHVTLHVNTPLQRFIAMDPFGGGYLAVDAIDAEREREETLIEQLRHQLSAEDVPWDIESSVTMPAEALSQAAILSDLLVLSLNERSGQRDPVTVDLVGDVAVAVRCPVLALPAGTAPTFARGPALIAWNCRSEAASALRAAVPLLAQSSSVLLVAIDESPDSLIPSTAALTYLSRHGIHAELVNRPRSHPTMTIEETLEKIASEFEPSWLVMGAYGHGRLRESMFGGVSRYMFDIARYPLLLAH